MKERPLLLWAQYLYRVKVCSNEHPPWSELNVANEVCMRSLRSTSSTGVYIGCKKLHVTLNATTCFALNVAYAVRTMS